MEDDKPRRVTLKEFEKKTPGRYMNPCEIESRASLKCLEINEYKKPLCKEYFDAYIQCKKLWMEERKAARFK
ncbi:hypothetical protein BB559_003826 [Furculomyces boomerangus]|uniref:Cytochrome c oxidase-assembly factor COX23, mitochondrial n=2 Tax=Harpellales TaxID=61421 RepID=A0A2T9YIF6_9FUNG|nr:hypothetical protein BB559_003826 [Furculomyces boomerangus]PWA02206.1 hypothetical protein BB558_001662 [Smittium angustum]